MDAPLGESEGVILSNIEIICEERVNFFGKLDSKPIGVAWRVEGLDWSPIFRESVAWLDCPFLKRRYSLQFSN